MNFLKYLVWVAHATFHNVFIFYCGWFQYDILLFYFNLEKITPQ